MAAFYHSYHWDFIYSKLDFSLFSLLTKAIQSFPFIGNLCLFTCFLLQKKNPATLSLPLCKVLLDVEFRVGRDIEYIIQWGLIIWPMRKQRVNVEPHAINGGVSDFQSVQFQQLSMLCNDLAHNQSYLWVD